MTIEELKEIVTRSLEEFQLKLSAVNLSLDTLRGGISRFGDTSTKLENKEAPSIAAVQGDFSIQQDRDVISLQVLQEVYSAVPDTNGIMGTGGEMLGSRIGPEEIGKEIKGAIAELQKVMDSRPVDVHLHVDLDGDEIGEAAVRYQNQQIKRFNGRGY